MNNPNQPGPTLVEALKAARDALIELDCEGPPDDVSHWDTEVAWLAYRDARDALLRAESQEGATVASIIALLQTHIQLGMHPRGGIAGGLPTITGWEDAAKAVLALAQPHHPTASVEAVARDALRRARDFIQDEVSGRIEAGGEETDYAKEAQDVLAVVEAALTAQQHPGLGSGDADLLALAWAYEQEMAERRGNPSVKEEWLKSPWRGARIEAMRRATEATGVVPATTPTAPIPTEDHEQGVRGSEERAGGES